MDTTNPFSFSFLNTPSFDFSGSIGSDSRSIARSKRSSIVKKLHFKKEQSEVLFLFEKNSSPTQKLFNNQKFSDWKVHLKKSDKTIHIISGLLAMWSPVFEAMFTSEMQESTSKTLIIDADENDDEDLFEYLLKSVYFETVSVPFSKIIDFESILEKYQMDGIVEDVRKQIFKQLQTIPDKSLIFSQLNFATEELILYICQHLQEEISVHCFDPLQKEVFTMILENLKYSEANKVKIALQWLRSEKERETYALEVLSTLHLEQASLPLLFQIVQTFPTNQSLHSLVLPFVFQKSAIGEVPKSKLEYQFINRIENHSQPITFAFFNHPNVILHVSNTNDPIYLSKIQIQGIFNCTYNYTLSIVNESTNATVIQQKDVIQMPSSGCAFLSVGLYLNCLTNYKIILEMANVQEKSSTTNTTGFTLKNNAVLANGANISFQNNTNSQFTGFEFGFAPTE